jgi:hypothetical protein
MACKRSAVRSRLAPPAFAGFASFGSASPIAAKAAAAEPEGRSRAASGTTYLVLCLMRYAAAIQSRGIYSPITAFNRSRNATISFFIADNSATVHAEAARMDWGTLLAFS